MVAVPARDLRNHTAKVLEQVEAGTPVTITVHGAPVAELRPVAPRRRRYLTRAELLELVILKQSDPGLTADLERLAGDTTDDL